MVRENFNKKLLAEGKDDQHVIWALCNNFNIENAFDIINCEGVERLIEGIPVRLNQPGLEALGIIIDADDNIENRWKSLKAILTVHGFNFPDDLPSNGLVINTEDNITIGIWIMPNNNTNGMLEDFIKFLIPENDPLLPIVNDTLESIENKNLNNYSLQHKSKAVIHTWLAWQKDPGTPLGLSITKKYLTTDKETCTNLINWINKVFNE